jgi:hypothetical protein
MAPRRHRRDLVRPYVLTGGRSQPSRNTHRLDVVTLVTATGDRSLAGLGPEQRAMVDLCLDGYLSLAEVASHLELPVTVTKVLIGDLLDAGYLVNRTPERAVLPDRELLEKVLNGLHTHARV